MVKNINLHKTWLLLFCVICVALPRFNRNQIFIKKPPADMEIHTAMVEYFRLGDVDDILVSKDSIAANWRPLFPLIASYLPFKPITSLSVLGIFSIFISVLMLRTIMIRLGIDEKSIYQTLYLYIFSFPVFYYTTIGYVDPGLILMITIGIYLIIKEYHFLFIVVLSSGIFMKEGIIVLLPFFWLSLFQKKMPNGIKYIWISSSIIIYCTISIIIRKLSINALEGHDLFWSPSLEMLLYNLGRTNSWLSFILVMGVPLMLIFYNSHIIKRLIKTNQYVLPLIAGAVLAIGTYSFAFISTVADGRTLWASYPFLFPIIGLIFTHKDRMK